VGYIKNMKITEKAAFNWKYSCMLWRAALVNVASQNAFMTRNECKHGQSYLKPTVQITSCISNISKGISTLVW